MRVSQSMLSSKAFSDIRSVNDESVPKRKEAERFEVDPMPQVSRFILGKFLPFEKFYPDLLTPEW